MTRLYLRAGIKGGSSHSGRCTFTGKVLATTGDIALWLCCWATAQSTVLSDTWMSIQAFSKKCLQMRYRLQKVVYIFIMQPVQRSIPYGSRNETF